MPSSLVRIDVALGCDLSQRRDRAASGSRTRRQECGHAGSPGYAIDRSRSRRLPQLRWRRRAHRGSDRHAEQRFLAGSLTSIARFSQHEHVFPAHLPEPRCSHHRAHFFVVTKHDAGTKRAGIQIGGLHQLATGRGYGTGKMPGRILIRITYIEICRSYASGPREIH